MRTFSLPDIFRSSHVQQRNAFILFGSIDWIVSYGGHFTNYGSLPCALISYQTLIYLRRAIIGMYIMQI